MNDFKVGDWILNDNNTKHVFQVKESDNLEAINSIYTYVAWTPKYKEWCWFYEYGWTVPILAQYETRNYETGCFGTEDKWYDICEPFFGELPSLIK